MYIKLFTCYITNALFYRGVDAYWVGGCKALLEYRDTTTGDDYKEYVSLDEAWKTFSSFQEAYSSYDDNRNYWVSCSVINLITQ